ncbi:hypothetical protein ZMO1_ZMO2049 [Zymomonas mobilis subsp. mobilis ZM4 = ATCC 31821]|nr:hypothetical protein ZMO1_ZMO2049 [Zymomonas mobilis subsp. mobilis ZM4 = ATCC 31821]
MLGIEIAIFYQSSKFHRKILALFIRLPRRKICDGKYQFSFLGKIKVLGFSKAEPDRQNIRNIADNVTKISLQMMK